MADYAIKVTFPSLTADGKIYVQGELEMSPGPELIKLAKSKEVRRHRDSNAEYRLAIFTKKPDDEEDFIPEEMRDEATIKRVPVYVEPEEPEDGLDEKHRDDLISLASDLGSKKPYARTLSKPNLIKLVRFLRTLI